MKKLLEKDIQKACLDYLAYKNIFAYKINNGGVYIKSKDRYMVAQTRGIPDAVFHYKGHVHYIEFKTPTGRMSEHQKAFEDQCRFDGVDYYVIRDLDTLDLLIKELDKN